MNNSVYPFQISSLLIINNILQEAVLLEEQFSKEEFFCQMAHDELDEIVARLESLRRAVLYGPAVEYGEDCSLSH